MLFFRCWRTEHHRVMETVFSSFLLYEVSIESHSLKNRNKGESIMRVRNKNHKVLKTECVSNWILQKCSVMIMIGKRYTMDISQLKLINNYSQNKPLINTHCIDIHYCLLKWLEKSVLMIIAYVQSMSLLVLILDWLLICNYRRAK